MTITPEVANQREAWPGPSSTSFTGRDLECVGGCWRHRCLVIAALVVLVGLVCVACVDPGSVSLTVIVLGPVRVRKAYRLDVNVDPKINAFLILEKARTGMTVAEIVEAVFREYQRRRSGATDDEGRRGEKPES